MFTFPILLWAMMLFTSSKLCSGAVEECSANFELDPVHCNHETFQNSAGWDTTAICDVTRKNDVNGPKCRNSTTSCRRHLRVSVFDQQLFSITMKNTFISMLTGCCEECAKCNVKEIEDTMNVNATILKSSDVIFPVLGESNVEKMNGFYFLPSYQVSWED